MNLDLTGKTALVAGSTQGIGQKTAEQLAKMGASVVLMARNEDKLKEVMQSLHAAEGAEHGYIVADFSKYEEVRERASAFFEKRTELHILVNNTGGPPGGPIIDAQPEDFLAAFQSHLICNHILAQIAVPLMRKAGYGRIINVVSTSVKAPLSNLGVSNTVRGAVANWAKTLANEISRYNITVNNVLPGATNTSRLTSIVEKKSEKTGKSFEEVLQDMNNAVPMKRVAEPEETADAIAFLASPAAGYINGTNVPVDGGRTPVL